MASVLLFGGSFDPVHNGHLIVSRSVAEQLGAARVILIPGALPPHKQRQRLAPAAERLELCRLAVADDPLFQVSAWEQDQPGPNYTLHTVRHFRDELGPTAQLWWLIGMDTLAELGTWYRIRELALECRLVTAGRPGFGRPNLTRLARVLSPEQIKRLERDILETPLIDISATEIRARVRAGRSIRGLVPEAVRRHIAECGLYAGD